MVGGAREVVKTWDIAMETLVDPEQPEEVSRRLVGGGAALPLPVGSIEVVALGKESTFTHVEGLGDCIEVEEAAS